MINVSNNGNISKIIFSHISISLFKGMKINYNYIVHKQKTHQ